MTDRERGEDTPWFGVRFPLLVTWCNGVIMAHPERAEE